MKNSLPPVNEFSHFEYNTDDSDSYLPVFIRRISPEKLIEHMDFTLRPKTPDRVPSLPFDLHGITRSAIRSNGSAFVLIESSTSANFDIFDPLQSTKHLLMDNEKRFSYVSGIIRLLLHVGSDDVNDANEYYYMLASSSSTTSSSFTMASNSKSSKSSPSSLGVIISNHGAKTTGQILAGFSSALSTLSSLPSSDDARLKHLPYKMVSNKQPNLMSSSSTKNLPQNLQLQQQEHKNIGLDVGLQRDEYDDHDLHDVQQGGRAGIRYLDIKKNWVNVSPRMAPVRPKENPVFSFSKEFHDKFCYAFKVLEKLVGRGTGR